MTVLRRLCLLAVLLSTLLALPASAGKKPVVAAPPAKLYLLALLRRGPAWTPERNAHTDSIQAGHLANIRRMFEAGEMYGAGPFGDDTPLRGLFVLATDSTGRVPDMLKDDPAIASKRLRADLYRWYGPEGLSDDYRVRAATGARDSMVTYSFVLLHRGPRWTANVASGVKKVLRRHAKHLDDLRRDGKLVAAGPIEGIGALRGVLVFDADTLTTRRLVSEDPAVKAGRFIPEIHPWWTAVGVIPGH
ncbi:MAG: hypothetical protein HZA61_13215 [Candidatus Eisenbacteria bacterium]|uniref:YCII-related domain-containing protein n=1 Tax=Eiseniibacteriota bacterium TaxID=2212470 RepID=A0A933W9B6_UNCEI|nr:hypothetical protein [Candidatus Eisenbacteria bacterium]